jgi:hypothetical protein
MHFWMSARPLPYSNKLSTRFCYDTKGKRIDDLPGTLRAFRRNEPLPVRSQTCSLINLPLIFHEYNKSVSFQNIPDSTHGIYTRQSCIWLYQETQISLCPSRTVLKDILGTSIIVNALGCPRLRPVKWDFGG